MGLASTRRPSPPRAHGAPEGAERGTLDGQLALSPIGLCRSPSEPGLGQGDVSPRTLPAGRFPQDRGNGAPSHEGRGRGGRRPPIHRRRPGLPQGWHHQSPSQTRAPSLQGLVPPWVDLKRTGLGPGSVEPTRTPSARAHGVFNTGPGLWVPAGEGLKPHPACQAHHHGQQTDGAAWLGRELRAGHKASPARSSWTRLSPLRSRAEATDP